MYVEYDELDEEALVNQCLLSEVCLSKAVANNCNNLQQIQLHLCTCMYIRIRQSSTCMYIRIRQSSTCMYIRIRHSSTCMYIRIRHSSTCMYIRIRQSSTKMHSKPHKLSQESFCAAIKLIVVGVKVFCCCNMYYMSRHWLMK